MLHRREAQMCWSSHSHYRSEDRSYEPHQYSRRPANDPVSAAGNVRVSDAERNRVVKLLNQHTADGRLTLEEFETRVEEALAARTGTELRAVLCELPSLGTDRRPRPRVSPSPMTRLPMILIAVALVWLTIGHHTLWPVVIAAVLWFRASACRSNPPRHRQAADRTDSEDMT